MKQRRLQPTREHPYYGAGRWIQDHEGMIIVASVILAFLFLAWFIAATAEAANIIGAGSYV